MFPWSQLSMAAATVKHAASSPIRIMDTLISATRLRIYMMYIHGHMTDITDMCRSVYPVDIVRCYIRSTVCKV